MKTIQTVTTVFLVLVGLAFLNIAVQAFIDPQSVMDFVDVQLNNVSARNSTRAYYGGVNLTFALFLIYGAFRMKREALILAALYGGGFVLGRLYSILLEGTPSSFIFTWLTIESVLTVVALTLLYKLSAAKQ
ncbi:MAG: DUF4345 domain-containing protein [Chitinophagales bacterium]